MNINYDLYEQLLKLGEINHYLIMLVLPVCIILAVIGYFIKCKWFKYVSFFLLIAILIIVIVIYDYIYIGYSMVIY